MKCEVLINYRGKAKTFTPEAEKSCQLFALPVDVMVGGKGHSVQFWDVARQTRSVLEGYIEVDEYALQLLDLFKVLASHPISWPIFTYLSTSRIQGRYKGLSISNLGRTDGRFEKGDFKLGKMVMGIDEIAFGHSIFVACASYKGDLNFTISYPWPVVSDETARAFGEGMVRRCIDMATSDPLPTGA